LNLSTKDANANLANPPRGWLAANISFVRTILFVLAYVFGALFLVTLFLFGGLRLVPKIIAVIFVACIAGGCGSYGLGKSAKRPG
jgi:VIT1/CCC1 family predicted Fe2+/Mn2+ transporter